MQKAIISVIGLSVVLAMSVFSHLAYAVDTATGSTGKDAVKDGGAKPIERQHPGPTGNVCVDCHPPPGPPGGGCTAGNMAGCHPHHCIEPIPSCFHRFHDHDNHHNTVTHTTTKIITVPATTPTLTNAQSAALSIRVATLQLLLQDGKKHSAECVNQIVTLEDITRQALDAANSFYATHMPTLRQGIPACYNSNAAPITEVL
jgi:hypothetical protein